MCNQCPTVGEFICSILRNGCCNSTCRHYENKCERKCEREDRRYECFCREKKDHALCEKNERDHEKQDCCCKFF